MSDIEVRLLGPPRILWAGRPAAVDTRKAIALLAYLAVGQDAVQRDSIAALLWPDHDQESARGALRRTLSTLKKALGTGLEADRSVITLERKALGIDIERFRSLTDKARQHHHEPDEVCTGCERLLDEAAATYRGDFMSGFALRDSPEFDDWQLYQAESLRRMLSSVLDAAAEQHAARGDLTGAIERARRWLSLDPLHEPAHQRLMELYSHSDQRAAALRQYRECVALLDRELGVEPLEQTTLLYQNIKEKRLAAPDRRVDKRPEPQPRPGRRPSDHPFTGRAEELADLARVLGPDRPSPSLVALSGEAGIGKTRLVEELLREVEDAVVATARCHKDEAGLPYGFLTELLRSAMAGRDESVATVPDHWLLEVGRLLPEIAALRPGLGATPELDSPGALSRFHEGALRFLGALCGHPRGVLFIDDIHWADDSSLGALAYILRRLSEHRLDLIMTFRTEEVRPSHPVLRLIDEARRNTEVIALELGPLTPHSVSLLVAGVAPDGGAELSRRLYEETEGIPFFLVEYLALVRSGRAPASGAWATPEGVRALLRSRIEPASETATQVLGTAAAIGSSVDFDTLRDAAGRSDEETVAALEELTALGLLSEVAVGTIDRSPTYGFAHEKVRSLVYEDTSSARRRILHRRIGKILARPRRAADAHAGQAARHLELAGERQEAADLYLRAAEHARSLFATAEALSHYESALALGHPETALIHEGMGDMYTLMGGYADANTSYEKAAAQTDDAATLEHKLGRVHQRRGDLAAAAGYLDDALASAPNDSARARIIADRALLAHQSGDLERAMRQAEDSLALAEAASDPEALAQARNMLGIIARARGDIGAAVEHLSASVELATELVDPSARVAALNNLALALDATGDRDAALAAARTALRLVTEQRDRHREAALLNNIADICYRAGDREGSMAHLKKAVAIFTEIGASEGDRRGEIYKLVEW